VQPLVDLARANAEHLRPYMSLGRDGFDAAYARAYFLQKIASWESGAEYAYGIWTEQLAGVVTLHGMMFDREQPELSYWIDKASEGRGIVTRAVGALIEAAREPLAARVFVITFRSENTRSRGVAERLGFQPAGVQRRFLADGSFFEETRYVKTPQGHSGQIGYGGSD
jgi:ribosomal-protein-serine acetyltransferase